RRRLHEDHRILRHLRAHLGGVVGIVLAHADHLRRQDRGEHPHLRQRPGTARVGGGAEGVILDLAEADIRIRSTVGGVGGAVVDRDEGDTVGTGDSTETHDGHRTAPASKDRAAVPTTVPPTERRALAILTVSVCAGIVNMVFLNSVAFLIPALAEAGVTLTTAGVLAGLPMGGTLLTLIGWGVLIDRIGERIALVAGLAATAMAATAAAYVPGLPALGAMLLLGGAAAASVNAATGRVIVGWFPPHRRGLAMGVRQAAQPLG